MYLCTWRSRKSLTFAKMTRLIYIHAYKKVSLIPQCFQFMLKMQETAILFHTKPFFYPVER